jgi:dGTPase
MLLHFARQRDNLWKLDKSDWGEIMLSREELEKLEDEQLAPYASRSRHTRGRDYPEEEHPLRSVFIRDRDRIIHCSAFRRLEYKTQVFVNHEGDYYRTRLTHTIEVAQITRTMARILRLNEELAEAIALAHDLGHTPFGHSGERVLNRLMEGHGGFEHNRQGLRVVEVLEKRYPQFNGLNLTWEVREGIIKHGTDYDRPISDRFDPHKQPSLEAMIVDIADEIAYNNHDLDDGLTSALIKVEDLRGVELWEEAYARISREYPDAGFEIHKHQCIRTLINMQVTDAIHQIERNIIELGIRSVEDIRNSQKEIVQFSPEMSRKNKELKEVLNEHLYRHYRVVRMAQKAEMILEALFNSYRKNVSQLPPNFYRRTLQEDPEVVICDYLAGMTDRYALEEYRKLFDPSEKT